ncbi:MAG TPA: diaminopimelate epimerase [Ruminiclostridium sp.]|nr:diaminopimelate epimerase [Ruminiclostridium sp.]
MNLKFYKMQGIGNDYVYINCFEKDIENPNDLSKKVSDRHFGIGSDGLILLRPSSVADVKMSMFNADGSEGRMCGNGIRCVGKLAYMLGLVRTETLTVETLSGIKKLKLNIENGDVKSVRVDMGAPALEREKIPVIYDAPRVVDAPMNIAEIEYRLTCVSMGNPHAVIFTKDIDDIEIEKIGPLFEKNKAFPESVNTEFVEILGGKDLKMRVWERGSGETLACGTGACAVTVAACINGICPRGEEINVHLKGGVLKVQWDNDSVWMTGPAELVFTGEIEIV